MYQQLKTAKTVVGAKQLKKVLQVGTVRQVFFAENADPAVTEPVLALCRHGGIPAEPVATMAELGRACGIEVKAAVAAVLR